MNAWGWIGIVIVVLLVLALIGFLVWWYTRPAPITACVGDDQCPLGNRCTAGQCVTGCTTDARCPAGQRCVNGQCTTPSTIIVTGVGSGVTEVTTGGAGSVCTTDAQCLNGFGCAGGRCVAGVGTNVCMICRQQITNGNGTVTSVTGVTGSFNNGNGTYSGYPPPAAVTNGNNGMNGNVCTMDAQCPIGQRCVYGRCTNVFCTMDAQCPTGSRCVGGGCTPITAGGNNGMTSCNR